MILLDTDHINVLQSMGREADTLTAKLDASADQDFAATAITIIALANGVLLVSGNIRDFAQVPNLRLENWLV